MLEHSIAIPKSDLEPWLHGLPEQPAVFALFGPETVPDTVSEPYISKTANLRRRMRRLLAPSFAGTRKLHLGGLVTRLDYQEVGSDFSTSLLLLQLVRRYGGQRGRRHLHLNPPIVLRLTLENAYPRAYVTNRITRRALDSTYGPFPSRMSAEKFLEDSLNLFQLRRCTETLHPDPSFPGCIYSEMKMCLAPCFRGCSDDRYAEEVARVRNYLASRGAWTVAEQEKERDAASSKLDFETAARLHQHIEKTKSASQQAAPLVHPLAEMDAVIVQPAVYRKAKSPFAVVVAEDVSDFALQSQADHVAIFLVRAGRIVGPGFYSVQGMRHPNPRAGSTSLYPHPALLEPTPIETTAVKPNTCPENPVTVPSSPKSPRGGLEQRLQELLDALEQQSRTEKFTTDQLSEHLSLLARWYYRPLHRRTGEIFFRPDKIRADSTEDRPFPLSRILRGISRVFCGQTELPGSPGQATVR